MRSVPPSPLRGRTRKGVFCIPLTLALSRKGRGNLGFVALSQGTHHECWFSGYFYGKPNSSQRAANWSIKVPPAKPYLSLLPSSSRRLGSLSHKIIKLIQHSAMRSLIHV